MVVSCVKKKIWDIDPTAPNRQAAENAYVGSYFSKNRQYARTFGEPWCILSAKYGLVEPDEEIENYNFTFKHRCPGLVTDARLREQTVAKRLHRFRALQVLGGKEYADRIRSAFADLDLRIETPLKGFRIGEALHAVQSAVDRGVPLGLFGQPTDRAENGISSVPVPPAIRRIMGSEDRAIAWHFFVFFSRLEYALKRSGRFLCKSSGNEAKAAWDDFGRHYNFAFDPDASPELKRAVSYFATNPPLKQIVNHGTLSWSEPQEYDHFEPLLKWLLVMVRRVRNNLFHGGKFPLMEMAEPSRDRQLLSHSIAILEAVLSLDNEVEQIFSEGNSA